MSGLDELKTRLRYQGGNAEGRFQNDKLRTLKKALLYSYQAATARLEDGREFRCLINEDKLKEDYDNKILSIPYKDICLNKPRVGKTTEGEEVIGIKPGDVFEWVETGTFWIVYLQNLEEDAYFMGDIRRCEEEVEINDHKYHVYIRGPVETTIQWNQKKGDVWNNLNYSLILYITKNEETLEYFHRFSQIEIDGNMWEVKTVNPLSGEGIIKVTLGEWFNNSIEKQIKEQEKNKPAIQIDKDSVYIDGPAEVKPYEICNYYIKNANDGQWAIKSKLAAIIDSNSESVKVEIKTGRSGKFTLVYAREEKEDITLPIQIKSL